MLNQRMPVSDVSKIVSTETMNGIVLIKKTSVSIYCIAFMKLFINKQNTVHLPTTSGDQGQ